MKIIVSPLLFLVILSLQAQSLKMGVWRAEIIYEEERVPFMMELAPSGGDVPEITIINGKERRRIANASIVGDSIFIPIDPFDVTIQASFGAMSMSGEYVKHYRKNGSRGFAATFGGNRFAKKSTSVAPRIKQRWNVTFSPDDPSMGKGVGIFKQIGDRVTGTILTETSDYRFFEGIVDGDSMKMSSFDGAHAFLWLGKKTGNDSWEGKIVFDNSYSEPWLATYDENAEIRDPFEIVQLDRGEHQPYYDLLAAGSGKDAIDVSKYEGRVLLIQLFGTWCPNSHDQTEYLVDWFEKNKNRNVSILASSYEANYSQDYGLQRLASYRETNKIGYDLVLGGRLSKTGAATPFPFMQRIEAFPTLIILDKEGYARYVHSYFNGPATGDYYEAFDKRFNEIMNELLEE